ncbi:DUF4917 family protein [Pseudoalteromonas sp. KAN5]|uniref:DUF4917 family protein n=1 Tax=Pseudoalteromonas sp. KAN5 TaxID=2916633 RepID=UPI001FCC4A7C|nr:DUF4917 family protein [Pseudoalteromonas sp. KAN5]BDF93341.1 DUF4917 domain-containing protein [Pseudoalteromonas sp. KAN5]
MITSWSEIQEELPNLLFGNGLGRTYWEGFSYKSLLELFGDRPVGRYLCTRELFNKLNTENFEEVLRAIYHAYQVSIDNESATKTLYIDVQNALIRSVNEVHPNYRDVPTEHIRECMSKYKSIFTTNYDLLPYWAVLDGGQACFVDYFWGDNEFDLYNSSVYQSKIPIHFLHGALHLRSEKISNTRKIAITLESDLDGALELDFNNTFPLFISEGKSQLKMNRIRSNSYLSFCYRNLRKSNGGLVVFGHDLNEEYDEHIVSAIKASTNSTVAISVFSGLDDSSKKMFVGRINALFADSDQSIKFFESNTHPFAQNKA